MTAKDKGTGKEQKIRIEASSGLTDDEINKMKAEAEANAEADRKAKEEIEKVNNADALIFQTEKQFKEYGDKIPADKKAAIESALEALKESHKNKDLAGIDVNMEKLNEAWKAASEDIYKATQGQPGADPNAAAGANAEANTGGGDDEVQDVDFEEVNDK